MRREAFTVTRSVAHSPVESAPLALPVPGGGRIARGLSSLGARDRSCAHKLASPTVCRGERFGGSTATRNPAARRRPYVERSMGSADPIHLAVITAALGPEHADITCSAARWRALDSARPLPSRRAVACRYGRVQVPREGRHARRTSWASSGERESVRFVDFVFVLARQQTRTRKVKYLT